MRGVALPAVAALAVALALLSVPAARAADAAGWWRDAVFYEVFVRSFQDSNGDGKGDLSGLIDRLDYLNDGNPATADDLGVTALWLMPIMESPSYHGYDVTDYLKIDTDYGTDADFARLISEAHRRGMRVILDLVLNHTSILHPWFFASLSRTSPARDWYIWSDVNPGYAGPWGQQVWHPRGGAFYYGLFWSGMPDLNYRNPDVTARMLEIARTWLVDRDVDGFRLDAARHLIEEGVAQEDTVATRDWLAEFRAAVRTWSPDAYVVGEVWSEPETIARYVGSGIDQGFEFSLADAVLSGVRDGSASRIRDALSRALRVYPDGAFATFLANHDQDRAMNRLLGNTARVKLAAAILLTLPGTPFLYYGEEIGMTGTKPDEHIRAPMQWTDEPGAGFTLGIAWEPLAADAALRTVAEQSVDPTSILSQYRRFIRLREAHAALRTGSTALVDAGISTLLGYVRVRGDDIVLVLHNVSPIAEAASVRASSLPVGHYLARDLVGTRLPVFVHANDEGSISLPPLVIDPYGTVILRLTQL
jgi:glycosidase